MTLTSFLLVWGVATVLLSFLVLGLNPHMRARSAKTSPQTLAKLARHREWSVRCGVALNPNTPPEVLMSLIDDPEQGYVGFFAQRHPNLPPNAVLLLLQKDPATFVPYFSYLKERDMGSDSWSYCYDYAKKSPESVLFFALLGNPFLPTKFLEKAYRLTLTQSVSTTNRRILQQQILGNPNCPNHLRVATSITSF